MSLITSNTGISSKNFALVIASIVGGITTLSFILMLFIDLFSTYTIDSDLLGLAAVITAVGGLCAAVFFGKVKAEGNEMFYDKNQEGD